MSHKITITAAKAFNQNQFFQSGNTKVVVRDGSTFMYLHDNMIAHKEGNTLYITHCGCKTNTTKERLNVLLCSNNLGLLHQTKGKWYIGNELFEGNKLFNLEKTTP